MNGVENIQTLRYGEQILKDFDPQKDLEIWPNKHEKNYTIKITLPEFCCLCPRSGYPDFATIYLEYIPDKFCVELKALKLYINSFMGRNISHEDSINEIYDTLFDRLKPKFMKITGDFNPRGNVHTLIEINSEQINKNFALKNENLLQKQENSKFQKNDFLKSKNSKSKTTSSNLNKSKKTNKDETAKKAPRQGLRTPVFADTKAKVVKKNQDKK